MAKRALIVKSQRPSRYRVQRYHRCYLCGRSRAYMRQFGLCRICFRKLALAGQIPGVRKSSW
jgi:small subunit ribosomal protein S14